MGRTTIDPPGRRVFAQPKFKGDFRRDPTIYAKILKVTLCLVVMPTGCFWRATQEGNVVRC
jgi:hypothetical protein